MHSRKSRLGILLFVLLLITGFAFYALDLVGFLVPLSAFTFFFILGLFSGFERALIHLVKFFGSALILSILFFGLLLIFPAQTFWTGLLLILVLAVSITVAVWRYYHGMLGRIQLHKWLS
ncbi:MAG: hypothetical protein ABIF92_02650 [archaeon]